MRKNVFGRQFSRDRNERQALIKGLLSSLVMKGRIETTLEKAKAIRPSAEKIITKARKEDKLAKKLLEQDLFPQAIEKVLREVAPGFSKRSGGYTRIIRIGKRFSDNASTAIIEWVEQEDIKKGEPKKKVTRTTKSKKQTKSFSKQKTKKEGSIASR